MDANAARWLIHRRPDGGYAAAEIAEELDDHFAIIEGDDITYVRKERGQQRIVGPDSLDLLHVQDPGALRHRFAEDAIETIVAVLADRSRPLSQKEVIHQLSVWGVEVDAATWKKLQPRLAKHPNVDRQGTPTAYSWRETVHAEEPIEKVLSRALSSRTAPDALDEARRRLASLDERGALSATERALAYAAGASVPPPDWSHVSLFGLDERPAEVLLEKASERRAWRFVAAAALEPGQSGRSARAAELLQHAESEERERPIREEITRLAGEMPSGAELGPYLDLVERRGALIDRALGDKIASTTIGALLRLAVAIPRETTAEAAPRVRAWSLVTAATKAPSRRALVAALEDIAPGRTQWVMLRSALSTLPLIADSPRAQWLAAFSQWPITAPTVQDDLAWWEGASLDDLASMDPDPDLGDLLRGPLARTQVLGAAVRRTLETDPMALPAVLALPDAQLRVLDPTVIAEAAERIDEAAALARMLAAIRAAAADRTARESNERAERVAAEHVDELARLKAELEAERTTLQASEARRMRLAEELDQVRDVHAGAFEGHRTQAQLEGLRSVAELLKEVEVAIPAVAASELSADEALSRFRRIAADADVQVDAEIGSEVTMDRSLYRGMDGDPPEGSPVRVISPAFVVRAGSVVTPLLYGYVVAADQ